MGMSRNSNLNQMLPASPPQRDAWTPPAIHNIDGKGHTRKSAHSEDKKPVTQMCSPASYYAPGVDWHKDKGSIGPSYAAKGSLLGAPYDPSRSPSPPNLAARRRTQQAAEGAPSPPSSPTELRQCLVTWTGDQLEEMVRDRIQQKTHGGNGQALMALRLFGAQASSEITPEMFRSALSRLLNTEITHQEALGLFNKYDEDGGGTLDSREFCDQLLPGFHTLTVKGQAAPQTGAPASVPYVRKCGRT